MVRSATALLAVLILAGFTFVQQVATHTVVNGDTLWDLAQTYYGNPFDWRRIWEANRSQVSDPNLIYPGWVLTIPGKTAAVTEVEVESPEAPMPTPAAPTPVADLAQRPTVFRQAAPARGTVITGADAPHVAVARDQVYSAPWLVRMDDEVASEGVVESFASGVTASKTPRIFDELTLSFSGMAPAVGTELQIYQVSKTIEDVGRVVTPSGVVRVTSTQDGTTVGTVVREFGRIQLGDLVGPLPSYSLTPGRYAQDVSGGSEAMVMGFAGLAVLQDVGEVAFLDQGSDDGVAVGDEYELVNPALGSDPVEGVLRVVGVTRNGASARILQMDDAVFRQGVVVRLSRKMR